MSAPVIIAIGFILWSLAAFFAYCLCAIAARGDRR